MESRVPVVLERRICRLHELAIYETNGRAYVLRYGDVVDWTPAFIATVGDHADKFERIAAAPSGRKA